MSEYVGESEGGGGVLSRVAKQPSNGAAFGLEAVG